MVVLWDFFSVFPAGAGMILLRIYHAQYYGRVPRGSGDDPQR